MTLTLEPRDLLGVEESTSGPPSARGGGVGAVTKDPRVGVKSVEVELRRRPGEGFGFVIASQEVTSGGECYSNMQSIFHAHINTDDYVMILVEPLDGCLFMLFVYGSAVNVVIYLLIY